MKDRTEYYRGKPGEKYGIYNTTRKCFQFGICEDTPMLAEARLFQIIGDDAKKWRFTPRRLCAADLLKIRTTEHKQEEPHAPKYTPVCPRGYTDCVCDPAYIKFRHPEWYNKLYGDKTPEEAAHERGGCFDRLKEDPEEKYYCYDDEDK